MTSFRPWLVPAVLVLFGAAFALGSCSSGSSKGTAGSGVNCAISRMAGTSCTEAQTKPYSDCLLTACDAQYRECLGPSYQSGTFSGTCAVYMGCLSKCACQDTACSTACGLPDAACLTCLQGTTTCAQTCTAPVCTGTGTGGSGGGLGGASGTGGACIASLQACCDAAPESNKANCQATVSGYVSGGAAGETICASALATLKSVYCPAPGGAGGSSGGAGGTCADLLACCGRTQAVFKNACMSAYQNALPMGDATCAGTLGIIQATYCP